MDVQTAADSLIALLDVSEKRYPEALAILHVNQGCATLSTENDAWFDRFIFDFSYYGSMIDPVDDPNRYGAIAVSGIANFTLQLGCGFIRNIFWLDDTKWKPLDGWEYRENLLTHNDERGSPTNVTIVGDSVLLRPVPEVDCTIRFEIKGKPLIIGATQTNGWLTHYPYAVLYRSAMYASIYMMEDAMLAKFTTMFREEADRASLHSGMMVMSEPRQAQEPG